jgi:hypothetical protein
VVTTAPPSVAPPAPSKPAQRPASAQAKPGRFRLKVAPEVEHEEELITPEKIKSWASSLAFHLLLFLVLWLGILSVGNREPKSIEIGLPAGDPHGSDLGRILAGGEGMDEPLATPFLKEETVVDATKLTPTDLGNLSPSAPAALSNPLKASASGAGGKRRWLRRCEIRLGGHRDGQ